MSPRNRIPAKIELENFLKIQRRSFDSNMKIFELKNIFIESMKLITGENRCNSKSAKMNYPRKLQIGQAADSAKTYPCKIKSVQNNPLAQKLV